MEQAPNAVVYWRMRPTLAETWRQYVGYAEGDALAGMYPKRHAVRFATYGALAAALLTRNRWLLAAAAAGGAGYAWAPIRRTRRRIPAGSPQRVAAVVAVPAVMVFTDAAKMWGYVRGLRQRRDQPSGI
jgi:hypothetical protein